MAYRPFRAAGGLPLGSQMLESVLCMVGHSNRLIEDFIDLLWTSEVAKVIDKPSVFYWRFRCRLIMNCIEVCPK